MRTFAAIQMFGIAQISLHHSNQATFLTDALN